MSEQVLTVAWLAGYVPIELWGEDHWSTFGYAHYCAMDWKGNVDPQKMRTDGNAYPTRLKNGALIKGHNDYKCLEDLEHAGFLNMATILGQHITITDKGYEAMKQLSKHKATGGWFSNFTFVEEKKDEK